MTTTESIIPQQINPIEPTEFIITPKFKKSFSEIGQYTKLLTSGKIATIRHTVEWRWGELTIYLTEEEREEILHKDHICMEDYHTEFISSTDGCDCWGELVDEESYTKEELHEIIHSACDTEDEENPTLDNDCNVDIMESEGGWDLDETYYHIDNGCVLVPEGEDEPSEKDEPGATTIFTSLEQEQLDT